MAAMRRRRLAVVLAVAVALVACSDRSRSSPSPTATHSDAMVGDAAATPGLTVEAAVALFEAVAVCRLEPHGLDHMCPERDALDRAYDIDVDPRRERYEIVRQAARRVIGHASPSVRARAFHRTLALLRDGPHRGGAPGKLTIDGIRGLAHAHRTFESLPPWVDMPATRAAVAAFVASPRADPDARRTAALATWSRGRSRTVVFARDDRARGKRKSTTVSSPTVYAQ